MKALPVLSNSRGCTSCELHEDVQSPGIPSRPWDGAGREITHKRALLIVGKAPGVEEDREGKALVGPCGIHTNITFVEGGNLSAHADVYLTNIVRCRMPNPKMAVPAAAIKACFKHLEADLHILDVHYEEVVILASGPDALKGLMGEGMSIGRFPQGVQRTIAGRPRTIFATYLAAILQERNDPSKLHAIDHHLRFVAEYLETGRLTMAISVSREDISRTNRVPPGTPWVAVDIETYGKISKFPNQRFFHPQKCMYWDGIARSDLVQTAGAAWRDAETGLLMNRFYNLTSARERDEFIEDMAGIARPDCTIVGANIVFDLMNLIEDHPAFRLMWEPFGPYNPRLVDFLQLSFMQDDTRPEKGLKRISSLLRVLEFGEVHAQKGDEYLRHDSADDPDLAVYQIEDVYATLVGAEKMILSYPEKYGPNTSKGTKFCLDWWSDIIWLSLSMSLAGTRFDRAKLAALHDHWERRLFDWENAAINRYKVALRDKGSGPRAAALLECIDVLKLLTKKPCKTEKGTVKRLAKIEELRTTHELPEIVPLTPDAALREVVLRTIQDAGLSDDSRIEKTDMGDISCNEANINLCLAYAGKDEKKFLQTWVRFHRVAKLVGSYLKPLLNLKIDPTRDDINKALVGDMAYPTIRFTPSGDDSGEEGGTQQVRMTFQGPAIQTFPKRLIRTIRSRHVGGHYMLKDSRQLELRVPITYSHEEEVAEDFRKGLSPYDACARLLDSNYQNKKVHPTTYHTSKTAILALQFRAQAKKLRETVRREQGIEKPLEFWEGLIARLYEMRKKLIAVQDAWIREAKTLGFLELWPLGVSRSFVGGPDTIDRTYIPTICNFRIQAKAAACILSAQVASEKWLRQSGYRTRTTLNIYDAGGYDVHPDDPIDEVNRVLDGFYREPPLYKWYVEHGDFPVPLDVETSIL